MSTQRYFIPYEIRWEAQSLVFNFTSNHMSLLPYQLQLDPTKEYEASLLSMEAYNTIFNITEKYDMFSYNPGSGYKTITV